MKIFLLFSMLMLTSNLVSCTTDNDSLQIPIVEIPENNNNSQEDMKLKITIGSKVYTAILEDNETTNGFKAMLPMTLNMNEHNGNEKYGSLSDRLPTDASNQVTIHNGDLMLFGASTLVLFYKTFSPSYSYTKIGAIDDPSGLQEALGEGNVTVTFGQFNSEEEHK